MDEDDLYSLELSDDEWNRSLESLLGPREKSGKAKRQRTESPKAATAKNNDDMEWIPQGRDAGRLGSGVQSQGIQGEVLHDMLRLCDSDSLLNAASWRKAVRELESNPNLTGSATTVRQIVESENTCRVPLMCGFVDRLTPNCNGSGYACLKDHTGEMGCVMSAAVFDAFPEIAEKCTLLLKEVTIMSTHSGDKNLVLTPKMIMKVFVD